VTVLQRVATSDIVDSVTAQANTIEAAHEHTEGELSDSDVKVSVTGSNASISDCLDQYDWFLVEDGTGEPDPAVTRGHFTGSAQLTLTTGGWKVSAFAASTSPC